MVEDHDLALSVLSAWFSARGHRVEACPPSRLGILDEIDRDDLVVLDLCLGDENGIDVLQRLADRRFRGDVVLISAFPDPVLETAREIGADFGLNVVGALRKPLAFDRLDALLSTRRRRLGRRTDAATGIPSLAEALANGRVTFHAQPILDVRTLEVRALELLARVTGADGVIRSVAEALAGADPDDLRTLAEAAVTDAATLAERMAERGLPGLPTAINVPPGLLARSFLDPISARLATHPVPITFEVSELDFLTDPSEARRATTRAVLGGVRFSLDDFGRVNSNLDRLIQLPFDELKLDRAFVTGCARDPFRDAVCRFAVQVARVRGVTMVAEGVETASDLVHLRSIGVDRAQGYYFTPPLAADAFVDWLSDRRPAPSAGRAGIVDLRDRGAPRP